MDKRGAVGSLFRFNLLKSTLINLYMLRGYFTVTVGDACLHCNVYTGIFCCCEGELRHIVLCFEAETRRLWILPNPSDPRERFLDVIGSTTLPVSKWHATKLAVA